MQKRRASSCPISAFGLLGLAFSIAAAAAFGANGACSSTPAAQGARPRPRPDAGEPDSVAIDLDAGTLADGALHLPCDRIPPTTVRAYVGALAHPLEFVPATPAQMSDAQAAGRALLDGDLARAKTSADAIGYRLAAIRTASDCLVALEPTPSAPAGHATLIARLTGYQRDLLLEAPHIPFDYNTDVETAIVFDNTGARAALFAGADRCALKTNSGCGTNDACSANSEPAASDPAHSVDTFFHAFHLAVASQRTLVVQFHSNIHPKENGDAQISNGTHAPFNGTVAEAFFKALAAGSGADVRTCNGIAQLPVGALCGLDNTQGHASNGVANVCTDYATSASDRFIHIEQNQTPLASTDAWSAHVADAIAKAMRAPN